MYWFWRYDLFLKQLMAWNSKYQYRNYKNSISIFLLRQNRKKCYGRKCFLWPQEPTARIYVQVKDSCCRIEEKRKKKKRLISSMTLSCGVYKNHVLFIKSCAFWNENRLAWAFFCFREVSGIINFIPYFGLALYI